MPSLGFSPAGLAPAASISAWLNPDAPSQSDRTPTLIVPPLSPPDGVLSSVEALPPLGSSSSSEPHPATRPSASVALASAISLRALTNPSPLLMGPHLTMPAAGDPPPPVRPCVCLVG